MKWTAREICRALFNQAFNHRHLIVCPNTYWPGSETDLLVVRTDLRLMEVEVKISRADLKADKHKDKWFDRPIRWASGERPQGVPRTHPRRIWKHYYCMPDKVWKEGLESEVQPTSGIILMRDHGDHPGVWLHRQAKPSKDAERITPEELADIARMQSTKLWDAYDAMDRVRRQAEAPAALTG